MNNYFSIDNKHISNSKISDWLKDKNFFQRKHILGEIKQVETQPLRIGKAVDCWLTSGKNVFDKNYIAVSRRNLKNPPEDYIELPMKEYEAIQNMCEIVEKQQAFQDLKDYRRQIILKKNIDGLGIWKGICGIPDFLKIDGDNAIIVDLKTSTTIEPVAYHYHCLKYGYYRQLAMYSLLVEYCYEITNIECKHFVVEKDTDGIFNCQTFTLDAERIENEKETILNAIQEIGDEKDFNIKNVGWNDSIPIGEIEEISF